MAIDLESVKRIYNLSRKLTIKDIQTLLRSAKPRSFAAREYLQEEGSRNRTLYFIQKGLIRNFLINDRGDEVTTWLRWENQMFLNLDVVLFEQPSRFYVQALEPTKTLTISFDLLQQVADQNPKLIETRKYFIRDLMRSTLQHNESFLLYSPEERYLKYIEQNPSIANRVPDKIIAHILGVTPVSLSRIRKRIAARN